MTEKWKTLATYIDSEAKRKQLHNSFVIVFRARIKKLGFEDAEKLAAREIQNAHNKLPHRAAVIVSGLVMAALGLAMTPTDKSSLKWQFDVVLKSCITAEDLAFLKTLNISL